MTSMPHPQLFMLSGMWLHMLHWPCMTTQSAPASSSLLTYRDGGLPGQMQDLPGHFGESHAQHPVSTAVVAATRLLLLAE